MGGYSEASYFKAGRAAVSTPMRVDEVVMRLREEFPGLAPVFHCRPMRADITVSSCVAQHSRSHASCMGCAVGKHHFEQSAAQSSANPERQSRHGMYANRPAMACIRCGADGHSERLIGRMRLVHSANRVLPGAADSMTLDVSCFNRATEVVRGFNSKKAKPVKHACLKEAVITYKVGSKRHIDVNVGLRSGVPEIRRLLQRGYGEGVKLVSVKFDGIPADINSADDPLYRPAMVAMVNLAPVAKSVDCSPAMLAVLAALEDEPAPSGVISIEPPALTRQTAAYRLKTHGTINKPVEKPGRPLAHVETMRDYGFPDSLGDLAAWLLDGITRWPSRAEWQPSAADRKVLFERPSPLAYPDAPAEAVDPVTDDSDEPEEDVEPVARAPITFSTKNASDWARGIVAQGRREDDQPTGCDFEALAAGCGLIFAAPAQGDDEPVDVVASTVEQEATQEPVRPTQKLTGKQRKRLEKAAKRFEREQRIEQNIAKRMPSTQAKPTAIASRALAILMGRK